MSLQDMEKFVRNKIAEVIVAIGKRSWPHATPNFIPKIQMVAQVCARALLVTTCASVWVRACLRARV